MSQKVDIVCDRCGTVMEGSVDQGAAPHWTLGFNSTSRRVGDNYAFDFLSWDLCEPCAKQVAEFLTTRAGLNAGGSDAEQAAVESLLG